MEKPIAWADDKAMSGQVGNVASASAKAYWERSGWADRESAKRLCHPLYSRAQLDAAIAEEREACAEVCAALRLEWSRMKVGATDGRYDMMEDAATVCEDEIRERSNAK